MAQQKETAFLGSGPSNARPPLPPRQSTKQSDSLYADAPPEYSTVAGDSQGVSPYSNSWSAHDPRSSSTQSLVPTDSNRQGDRRRLLLIFIHGFMGNETSFRAFPAHVHNLLTVFLTESHVVHTKIYPRYRSKRDISFARDDFSRWLEPHESDTTDVVLLGHSMGGLVSADVILMPPPAPASRPTKHRILGTINFDVPFLGMHPGVVKSGLASLFQPEVAPADKWASDGLVPAEGTMGPGATSQSVSSPWQPEDPDPNFNPSFNNDVVLPVRKGWRSAWHFVSKHSNDLTKATTQLVSSHLEFGGAMARYGELKARYARVRALEEGSEMVRKSVFTSDGVPPRVRFVNYYTASTGRPKRTKVPMNDSLPGAVGSAATLEVKPEVESAFNAEDLSGPARSSVESQSDGGKEEPMRNASPRPHDLQDDSVSERHDAAEALGDQHLQDAQLKPVSPALEPADSNVQSSNSSTVDSLPPIPILPTAPPPLDVGFIQDKDTRKLVEKEHARAVKAYEKAIKEREKMIVARAKLDAKNLRKALKENEKASRDAIIAQEKAEKGVEAAQSAKGAVNKTQVKAKQADPGRDLTHQEMEHERLEKERLRMAAESSRLRGESLPDIPPRKQPSNESLSRGSQASSAIRDEAPPQTSDTNSPPKERKFCTLPPKDAQGQRDPCWVRVLMKDVDEVGAHCGLFFVDERYERLVGDVADRIEGWVAESLALRMIATRAEKRGLH